VTTTAVDVVLAIARNPEFFSLDKTVKMTTALARVCPDSGGSLFITAVDCALRAHSILNKFSIEYDIECAYMLAYLHFSGDPRAAVATKQPFRENATIIANGLSQWAERSAPKTVVRPASRWRCWFPKTL
jgi:hypothetical protein